MISSNARSQFVAIDGECELVREMADPRPDGNNAILLCVVFREHRSYVFQDLML